MSDHDITLLAAFLASNDLILDALYQAELTERISILTRAMSRADGMCNDAQEFALDDQGEDA